MRGDAGTDARSRAADDWSAWLHALWRAADQVQDVTGMAGLVYRALLSRPGVVLVVGTRWVGNELSYLRYASGEAATAVTRRGPLEEWPGPVPPPDLSRAREAGVRAPVLVDHSGPEAGARMWPGGPAVPMPLRSALECLFPLGEDDWATLRLGLDRISAEDDLLRGQLVQVAEVLMTSNQRIVEHQAHERRQVADAFLAEASLQMDASLDVDETLRRVARLAVPAVAEGCVVHIFEQTGDLTPVALAHVAATAQDWLGEVARNDPWMAKFLRASADRRETTVLTSTDLIGGPFGPEAAGQGAGVRAVSASPLRARGRTLGTLTFLYHRDGSDVADRRMIGDLASRAALAIDTSTLYEQRRNHVEVLQRHLLPGSLPEVRGLALSAAYQVADDSLDVGGDFYDAVVAGDGIALVIGDVCGRGAEAAAVTGLARHTLRTLLQDRTPPGEALRRLNSALIDEHASRFVTAVIAVLAPGPDGWHAEVASAGHPRPLVRRAAGGDVEEVPASGLLLGIVEAAGYGSTRLELGPGDSLVMFTDGLTEAKGADGTYFESHLVQAVEHCVDGGPDPADRLIAQASRFRRTGDDDTAILIASVEEPS